MTKYKLIAFDDKVSNVFTPKANGNKPVISIELWQVMRDKYVRGELSLASNDFVFRGADIRGIIPSQHSQDIFWLSDIFDLPGRASQTLQYFISEVMLLGGTGGRLFGFDVPESQRTKAIAKLFEIDGRSFSALEIRMAYLYQKFLEYKRFGCERLRNIHIMTNDYNRQSVEDYVKQMFDLFCNLQNLRDITLLFQLSGIPRIVPAKSDLLASELFIEHNDVSEVAAERVSTKTGQVIINADGEISVKSPGHLGAFTQYVMSQMKRDLIRGVNLVLLHPGEELGMLVDNQLLNFAGTLNKSIIFIVTTDDQRRGGGVLVEVNGRPLILEQGQIPSDVNLGRLYKNTFQVIINPRNILEEWGLTFKEFMEMSEEEIRQLVNRKIYSQLTPMVEVVPIDNFQKWAAQFVYLFGQLSWIMNTGYIITGSHQWHHLINVKTKEDIPRVLPVVSKLYGEYIRQFLN